MSVIEMISFVADLVILVEFAAVFVIACAYMFKRR